MAGDDIFGGGDDLEETQAETQATQQEAQAPETQTTTPEAGSTGGDGAGEDDDLFSFLDNDAGPDPDNTEPAPVESNEQVGTAPASVAPPAPSPMDRLAEQMSSFIASQTAAPAAQPATSAPPVLPAYVPVLERPENRDRVAQLEQDSIFSADAARELRTLERNAVQEDMRYEMRQQMEQERATMRGVSGLQQRRDEAYNSVRENAAWVDRASYDAAEQEFMRDLFGGDQIAFASALNNPQAAPMIQKQIANNAKVAAMEARGKSRAKPTSVPATTARPAATASPTRTAAPSGAQGTSGRTYSEVDRRLADDSDYEQEISSRAFGIGKKRTN